MRCPFCAEQEDRVIDSRVSKDGRETRRRRECVGCNRRYTTYERVEESMPIVVKRDGSREPFDRNKIERGLSYSCAKRPVTTAQLKALAEAVERDVGETGMQEITSHQIGERVLPKLRQLDEVAFVRFASIYRDFSNLDEFTKQVETLKQAESGPLPRAEAGVIELV